MNAAVRAPGGRMMFGAPSKVAQPPHRCTVASSTQIAQQIPGAPWEYSHSMAPTEGIRMRLSEVQVPVVTPMGAKTIPARISYGATPETSTILILRCPYTSEQFIFRKPAMIGSRALGFGTAAVPAETIAIQIEQVNGSMDSTDQAVKDCTAMAATDVAQWTGIYAAWKLWVAGLQTCLDHAVPSIYTVCMTTYGYDLWGGTQWAASSAKLTGYAATAVQWQGIVHKACSSYVPPAPPPNPSVPPVSGGFGDQIATGAKAIGVLALVAVGAYAAYEVVKVAGGIAYIRAKIG